MEGTSGVSWWRFMARALGISALAYVWLDFLAGGVLSRVTEAIFEHSQDKLAGFIERLAERESAPRGPG